MANAPKTLEELGALADITLDEIARYTEQGFEELLIDELEVEAKARPKLQKQHRALLDSQKKKAAAEAAAAAAAEAALGTDADTGDEGRADAGEEMPVVVAPGLADEVEPTHQDSDAQAVRMSPAAVCVVPVQPLLIEPPVRLAGRGPNAEHCRRDAASRSSG